MLTWDVPFGTAIRVDCRSATSGLRIKDGRANVGNDLVEFRNHLFETITGIGGRVGEDRAEMQRNTECPLNDPVVQIAIDAVRLVNLRELSRRCVGRAVRRELFNLGR